MYRIPIALSILKWQFSGEELGSFVWEIIAASYSLVECAHLLLAHNAPVKVKNAQGWSPLAEAISYGDRQMSKKWSLYFCDINTGSGFSSRSAVGCKS